LLEGSEVALMAWKIYQLEKANVWKSIVVQRSQPWCDRTPGGIITELHDE